MRRLSTLLCFFGCLTGAALFAGQPGETGSLFNGKDLEGWKIVLAPKDQGKDTSLYFTAREGVLIIDGKVLGMIHSDKSFSNYRLSFDWLYPKGSTPESNSGALIHLQAPLNKIWPVCLEPQGRYKVKVENNQFDQEALNKVLKPLGEWNSTEITCKADGSVAVKVNGTPVASGTSRLKDGPVGFQSEGHTIHLRQIRLVPVN